MDTLTELELCRQKLAELTLELDQTKKQLEAATQAQQQAEAAFEPEREQLNFLTAVIKYAAEGVCVVHEIAEPPYTEFTVWNDQMVKITGYTLAEINRLGWFHLYPDPEVQAYLVGRVERMWQGDDLQTETYPLRRADGEKRMISATTSILKITEQQAHILAVINDVNEQKQAEAALRESERFIQRIIKTVPGNLYLYDFIEHRLIFVGHEIDPISGYTSEHREGMGDSFLPNVIHPDDLPLIGAHYQRFDLAQEGEVLEYEFRIRSVENQWRWSHSWEIVFARTDDGRVSQILGISQDVTEYKQVQAALQEYSERLEEMVEERTQELQAAQEQLARQEKLAMLGQLAGGVGHELRNPLAVISNAVYFLRLIQPEADDTVKEYLEIITGRVQEAEKIVADLLNLSRGRSAPEETSLTALLDEALQRTPAPPNVEVSRYLPAVAPRVFVDPQQIGQVLTNLITNAYQAMPAGGHLRIEAQIEPGWAYLVLHDNGEGMNTEIMAKIFEPLFTTKARGIGLGLAVSKNLATVNRGDLSVSSTPGQGSTFTLSLPTQPLQKGTHDGQTTVENTAGRRRLVH